MEFGGCWSNARKGSWCHHSAVIDANRWPDDTVLLDLNPKLVCTKWGIVGGQVRLNWDDRVLGESLTGTQWSNQSARQ
jgi:hypothetical protein